MSTGIVAIGRNEGARLARCLNSLPAIAPKLYVDSGSSDHSVRVAHSLGINVLKLEPSRPFSAARARNEGCALVSAVPAIRFIQFVDGDCELFPSWTLVAANFLENNSDVAAVSGILLERNSKSSIYNWLCEKEWEGPTGEINRTGGILMVRASAFEQIQGYREDLIAGEDDDFCIRLRLNGWKIFRLEIPMATHDANITRFGQWWQRSIRAGYAYANLAVVHNDEGRGLFKWELLRAWLWAAFLPVICFLIVVYFWPYGLFCLSVFPAQILRLARREKGPLLDRLLLSSFRLLGKFPEIIGHLKFAVNYLLGRASALIEYK